MTEATKLEILKLSINAADLLVKGKGQIFFADCKPLKESKGNTIQIFNVIDSFYEHFTELLNIEESNSQGEV